MLQSMTLKTLFQWQTYFRQRLERNEADAAAERLGSEKTPEQIISILDHYRGSLGG